MKTSKLKSLNRLALAFAISPLVMAFLTGAWMWIGPDVARWRTPSMIAWDTIAFSYLAVVLVGLPLTALFAVLSLRKWWHYTMAGLILGVGLMILNYQIIPVSETPGPFGEDSYLPIDWLRSFAVGLIAALTAIAFWWLRYGNIGQKREMPDEGNE